MGVNHANSKLFHGPSKLSISSFFSIVHFEGSSFVIVKTNGKTSLDEIGETRLEISFGCFLLGKISPINF
jgi:hypothetical protein